MKIRLPVTVTMLVTLSVCASPKAASAHCDGLDGPVVKAAQRAFEAADVRPALIWVQPKDEAAVGAAFREALAVRKLGPDAKALAERHFFETLVRLHRAGEGAPFTGLKPPGRDLGPAIPAADKALEDGSAEPLVKLLSDAVGDGLRKHFRHAREKKDFGKDDVAAGREYVRAYVEFLHYAERIHQASEAAAHGHHAPTPGEGP